MRGRERPLPHLLPAPRVAVVGRDIEPGVYRVIAGQDDSASYARLDDDGWIIAAGVSAAELEFQVRPDDWAVEITGRIEPA